MQIRLGENKFTDFGNIINSKYNINAEIITGITISKIKNIIK